MLALKRLSTRAAHASLRIHRQNLRSSHRTLTTSLLCKQPTTQSFRTVTSSTSSQIQSRTYATKTSADDLMEKITEQYATARDEFEIASEETDKKSVYAAEDRDAARDELNVLKEMYEQALQSEAGEEIRGRVGQRIRELDNAVQEMEKKGLED